MKLFVRLASLVALSAPAFCADLVVTKSKHTDAFSQMGNEVPARDVTEVSWLGKGRMRSDEGDRVTIVRTDLKKLYILDTKAKTYSALDLPVDLEKLMGEEMAPMMKSMFADMKVTVTPSTDTKKIKDWNVTRYTVSMTMSMGTVTKEIWTTKDVEFDKADFHQTMTAVMSVIPGGAEMGGAFEKIEGFPISGESTQTMMGSTIKAKEEVVSIEKKEPAEGWYDVPKDFTEKPFDFMADMAARRGGAGAKRAGH